MSFYATARVRPSPLARTRRLAPARARALPSSMSDLGVRANLDPTTWAGTFVCAGPCGRERLPAVEFSKKMVARLRLGDTARCLACVDAAARAERERASANAAASNAPPATCSVCSETKPSSEFSKTQLRRGDGARRCARCARDEASGRDGGDANAMKARLMEAREASERAEATNARDKLAVFAREASLEATAVTGLEATFVGGRRGRGRGRGGRGRSNPNSMLGRGGRR